MQTFREIMVLEFWLDILFVVAYFALLIEVLRNILIKKLDDVTHNSTHRASDIMWSNITWHLLLTDSLYFPWYFHNLSYFLSFIFNLESCDHIFTLVLDARITRHDYAGHVIFLKSWNIFWKIFTWNRIRSKERNRQFED